MDEQADNTDISPASAAAAKPVARSIGERLRAGRDRAGLGVAAAAEKLHLDPRVIEALEGDRFAEVGASVYVRGHLRRYGDFVGENGAELVAMYQARDSRPTTPDLTQVPHAERRADPRKLVTPLVVLAAGTVLATAIWWVLGSSPAPTGATAPVAGSDPAPDRVIEPEAGATTPVSATPVTLSNAPVAGTAAPEAPVVAPSTPTATATPAATSPTAPAPAREPTPPRETRLRLELSGDSWVEVYDYRGERLFFDVASGGSVQTVSGRGPLRVVLENAAAVTIEVDGQRRELPQGALEGERARFVVNRSGSLSRAR